jgi:hypothetical protein
MVWVGRAHLNTDQPKWVSERGWVQQQSSKIMAIQTSQKFVFLGGSYSPSQSSALGKCPESEQVVSLVLWSYWCAEMKADPED